MKQIFSILGRDFLRFLNSISLPLLLVLFVFCVTDVMVYAVNKGPLHWYSVIGCLAFILILFVYLPYESSKDMKIPLPQPFKTLAAAIFIWGGVSLLISALLVFSLGCNTLFSIYVLDNTWERLTMLETVSAYVSGFFIGACIILPIGVYIYSVYERIKKK